MHSFISKADVTSMCIGCYHFLIFFQVTENKQ